MKWPDDKGRAEPSCSTGRGGLIPWGEMREDCPLPYSNPIDATHGIPYGGTWAVRYETGAVSVIGYTLREELS